MEKLKALFESRRFWVAVSTVIVIVLNALGLPIEPSTVLGIVTVAASWIVGDSLRPTETEATKQMRMQAWRSINHEANHEHERNS